MPSPHAHRQATSPHHPRPFIAGPYASRPCPCQCPTHRERAQPRPAGGPVPVVGWAQGHLRPPNCVNEPHGPSQGPAGACAETAERGRHRKRRPFLDHCGRRAEALPARPSDLSVMELQLNSSLPRRVAWSLAETLFPSHYPLPALPFRREPLTTVRVHKYDRVDPSVRRVIPSDGLSAFAQSVCRVYDLTRNSMGALYAGLDDSLPPELPPLLTGCRFNLPGRSRESRRDSLIAHGPVPHNAPYILLVDYRIHDRHRGAAMQPS